MTQPRRAALSPAVERTSSRAALVTAAVIVLALSRFVPFGRYLLYPFTLLGTWVHEMGHGISAILVGGSFHSLDIFANAAGLAHSSFGDGWPTAIVSAGGLLGPPVVGAAMLAFARGPRRARIALAVLGGAMALSLLLWVRSLAGWIAIPGVLVLVAAVVRWGSADVALIGAQLVGLLMALDTVTRIDYLFKATAHIGGKDTPSDVANIARALGGSYLAWGALLAAISLLLCALGLWAAWRRGRRA